MSARKVKTKIVNGEVVTVVDSDASQSLLSTRTIDVFGFNVDVKQFLVSLAIISFFLGPNGSEFMSVSCWGLPRFVSSYRFLSFSPRCFLLVSPQNIAIALIIALGAYALFNRITSGQTSSSGSASTSGVSGGGGGRPSGSNIRGVKDLPCDPKVG